MFCVISDNKNGWWQLSWAFLSRNRCEKNIHLIEPGNQPPQLTENLLTKVVVLEFVKFDNKQKLMYIMAK